MPPGKQREDDEAAVIHFVGDPAAASMCSMIPTPADAFYEPGKYELWEGLKLLVAVRKY